MNNEIIIVEYVRATSNPVKEKKVAKFDTVKEASNWLWLLLKLEDGIHYEIKTAQLAA